MMFKRSAKTLLIGLVLGLFFQVPHLSAQETLGGSDEEILKFATPEVLQRARDGDAVAQMMIGGAWVGGKSGRPNHANAKYWLQLSADQGLSIAQVQLGTLHQSGLLGESDFETAAGLFEKAAEQGDPMGALRLSELYFSGRGVEKDDVESARLMKQAANGDIPVASHYYADMLSGGHGVAKDDTKALQYYVKAAEAGWPESARTLAVLYFAGKVTEKDNVASSKWLHVAAGVLGENDGLTRQFALAILPNLSAEEISQGNDWAIEFIAANEEKISAARSMR
jgi:TPR repeat protein